MISEEEVRERYFAYTKAFRLKEDESIEKYLSDARKYAGMLPRLKPLLAVEYMVYDTEDRPVGRISRLPGNKWGYTNYTRGEFDTHVISGIFNTPEGAQQELALELFRDQRIL